jgi:hypothetical protein
MIRRQYLWAVISIVFLVLGGAIIACREAETVEVTRIVERTVEVPAETIEVEVTRIVEVPVEVMLEPAIARIPFEQQWSNSPHANAESRSFTNWDGTDNQEIPITCAKCHSTTGYLDYLGVDGSEFGVVNNPAPIGTVITCEACHNPVASNLTSVTFPSGAEIHGLGAEARCMECHQGRASTATVNASIENAGLSPDDEDVVSEDLGFTNIHFYAAAATQHGTLAMGGYEYEGMAYDGRFDHPAPFQTCVDCHNPHTLEVRVEQCTTCHENVRTAGDLVNIRTQGSMADFSGDGNLTQGIYFEIRNLQEMLIEAMQRYAVEVPGTPIGYFSAHPYFFIDTDGDGQISADEAAFPNRYNAWTPRLAKAAYNYQVSLKDSGSYAHGSKYIIQLLHDSINSLNEVISEPIDMQNARRIDHGHFAHTEAAFRYWDEQGAVPATCSKCHTATGLPFLLEHGVQISQPPSSSLSCSTCHDNLGTYTIYEVEQVTFPSGAVLSLDDPGSNTCLQCHQGRESTTSMNRLIGDMAADTVSEQLRFLNIHYFSAGATLFGTEAQGAYEYAGREYIGRNPHVPAFDSCSECHSVHAQEVLYESCTVCHDNVNSAADLPDIRVRPIDYSGNGDAEQGLAFEIQYLHELLYEAIQEYARVTVGAPIAYTSAQHPYYFNDLNDNGIVDPDERNRENQYNSWTPRLLRAAYNYQYVAKDTGAYAHNGLYIIQVLQDSLADLGVDTSGMTRPTAPPVE